MPTLILLGSFLVPFCVVLFVVERVPGNISTMQLILAFFVGGIFGVLGASLLEADLGQTPRVYVFVGLIEEFVKGVILVIVGWRVAPKTAQQGALLGATSVPGFAAFESAGYAFNAAITAQGIDSGRPRPDRSDPRDPRAGRPRAVDRHPRRRDLRSDHLRTRFRWSWWIPVAYLGAALLHAMWDSASEVAAFIALLLNGEAMQELQNGFLLPRTADSVEALSTVIYIICLAVTSAAGIVTLWLVLRHFRRTESRWAPAA